MRKKQFFGLGVGLSSVVMIFVVLCLTTLAVLAYFCAKADTILTNKKAEYAIAYQNADTKAKKLMAEIDEYLYNSADEGKNINAIEEEFSDEIPISIGESKYIYYSIEITSELNLLVKLQVNIDENGIIQKDNRLKICEWNTVNEGYELEDDNLDLWGNNNLEAGL